MIEKAGYGDCFFHGTGHHLGLEVHDITPDMSMKPGCVITIEPGIYIQSENIGIRIEDDILITREGHSVLTSGIPKSIQKEPKRVLKRSQDESSVDKREGGAEESQANERVGA